MNLKRPVLILALFVVLVVILVAIAASAFFMNPDNGGSHPGPDTIRVTNLREVQNEIQLYYKKCGYYPGTAQSGATCDTFKNINSWNDLTNALIESNLDIKKVPADPVPGKTYFYAANADGSSYVVGALLTPGDYYIPYSEATGTIDGLDCGAPMFCVKL